MFKFTIVPDGGESFQVAAGLRDIRMWEKTHRGRTFGSLTDSSSMSATALFEVAYVAAKRAGKFPAGLTEEQFATDYDIELDEEDADESEQGPDFIQPEA